jgi:hypothetical protein
MFFGGGFSFDDNEDFDEFSEYLEGDSKFMKKMMKEMGANVRVRGKRRKQPKGAMGGNPMGGMDDIMSFLMNPGMGMGMGMGMSFVNQKAPKKS